MRALVPLLVLAACTRTPTPTPTPTPPAVVSEDCTHATALTPGIPGSPGHFIASERNPNGASELAQLMRRFVDDWKEARTALGVDAGVTPKWSSHRHMRCSWPTDLADHTEAFDGMAVNYLNRVKAFDEAPSRERYQAVLDGCKACHEVTCGGPLEVIEGLR